MPLRPRVSAPLFALIFIMSATAEDKASRWWEEIPESVVNDPTTLGLWKFTTEVASSSGQSSHKHEGTIKGATWKGDGKFGGCLVSDASHPPEDKPHGFWVKRSPLLSPSGPFTLEMWIRPKPAESFPPEMRPVLVGSKYTPDNHTGLMWSLGRESSSGKRVFQLSMELGKRSEDWYPEPVQLIADDWQHVGFSYDARGTVSFFLNGNSVGISRKEGAGTMAPAIRELALGDRIGSTHRGFPGSIDEVLLSNGLREYRPLKAVSSSSRPVFRRFSKRSENLLEFSNLTAAALEGLSAKVTVPGSPSYEAKSFSELGLEAVHEMRIPVDSSLRPGSYEAEVAITVPGWGGEGTHNTTTTRIPFVIVPRPLPHRMPVVMWGLGGGNERCRRGNSSVEGSGIYPFTWIETKLSDDMGSGRIGSTGNQRSDTRRA